MIRKHCGLIAVIGAPNAGKSTLINRLAGGKISIVTPKEQTTRRRMRGISVLGQAQMVFIDTPGIFESIRPFERNMVEEAWTGVKDADCVLVVMDAVQGVSAEVMLIAEGLKRQRGKKPFVLALNKVDAVQKPYLLKLAAVCAEMQLFEHIFMISGLTGDGVEEMKAHLAALLPQGPWLYPEDQLSDQPMRVLAAEITREKLFMHLRQELPYSIDVETESWEESEGLARIAQTIIVEREGQKKIVIGKKGENLKKIGMSARRELERMLGKQVHLELFVKVEKDWKAHSL